MSADSALPFPSHLHLIVGRYQHPARKEGPAPVRTAPRLAPSPQACPLAGGFTPPGARRGQHGCVGGSFGGTGVFGMAPAAFCTGAVFRPAALAAGAGGVAVASTVGSGRS
eukprot:657774-Alexandrium_andersonii.AAC.1